ncbi:winged helix-turn-helix transcriptional regulator [Phytoactinopolyspora halotolerans]|uniref:winged helix-turn-helix transcriptional regulator n=1 Tax=Phytoactinopolyspora halotolerans TaxID=1981512 RepID=UPI001C209E86
MIATLHDQRMRFTELQQRIPGISQRMLTLTVRNLERDGLVSRTTYAEVPPRVEYELTDVGRTLIDPAVRLAEWAVEHNPDIDRSRQLYDEQQPSER